MKFFVIEGLDGSGKSTQVINLKNYFETNNIKYKYLHFPRTDSPVFGELVSMFLRGDLGKLEDVNPYLVALIYAGDRDNAKLMIEEWAREGYLIMLDRYVFSNIAFQCAKIDNTAEQEKLMKWIINLEYEFYKILKPNLNIFLDAPFNFVKQNLEKNREGDDRDYLQGKVDIHEENLEFQEKVRKMYLKAFNMFENTKLISCFDDNNEMLDNKVIFEKIISILKEKNFI